MSYLSRLRDAILALEHTPCVVVTANGRQVESVSGQIDSGVDVGVAEARVELAEFPDWLQFKQDLLVELGYNGLLASSFRGQIEEDEDGWPPQSREVVAGGQLRLTRYQLDTEKTYGAGSTDTYIADDLLSYCGVTDRDIEGAGWDMAVDADLVVKEGDEPLATIQRIDQVTGRRTWDNPADGRVMRREYSGNPSGTAAWQYEEGENVFLLERPRTIRTVHNKVKVTGRTNYLGVTPEANRRADNPLNPSAHDVTYRFQSDLLFSDERCMDVAIRELSERNCVVEQIKIEVPGNPLLNPADTIALKSPRARLSDFVNCHLAHHTIRWGNGPMRSVLTLERRVGDAGYNLGRAPRPSITYRVMRQTYLAGTYYSIWADGSGTTDPDTPVDQLTFAWTNDQTADTSTDADYKLKLTAAQFPVEITLTVSDGTNSAHAHQVVELDDPMVVQRQLSTAAATRADATPDCGATWRTAAIAAISCAPIQAESFQVWGTSDSKAYKSADWLATAAVLAHTFAAAVKCCWMSESDPDRVHVGLQNGDVWRTLNFSAGAASTWTKLRTFAAAVEWIVESYDMRTLRVCSGNQVYVSFDALASVGALVTFASGNANRIALSFFANYYSSDAGLVKREDGVALAFPVMDPPITSIRGLAHHIRDDVLYCLDQLGRVYEKPADSDPPTFAHVGDVGGGEAFDLLNDGDFPNVLYAGAADGIYKSDDSGAAWGQMRDYTGAGLDGLRLGRGAETWVLIAPTTIQSAAGEGKVQAFGVYGTPTDGWRNLTFDDSAWAAASLHPRQVPIDAGSERICPDATGQIASNGVWCHRRVFALPAGAITAATLRLPNVDYYLPGVWMNNVLVGSSDTAAAYTGDNEFSIPPTVLKPGDDNILAIQVRNDSPGVDPNDTGMEFKLVVS
jgi:hypothetical protein